MFQEMYPFRGGLVELQITEKLEVHVRHYCRDISGKVIDPKNRNTWTPHGNTARLCSVDDNRTSIFCPQCGFHKTLDWSPIGNPHLLVDILRDLSRTEFKLLHGVPG